MQGGQGAGVVERCGKSEDGKIWVNAAVTDANRGKVLGLNGALFSAGMICGPLVLGWTGTATNLPFYISAGLIVGGRCGPPALLAAAWEKLPLLTDL